MAVIFPNTGTLFILATLEAILLSFVKVILAASSRAAFSSWAGVLFIILLTNSPCALVPGVNPFWAAPLYACWYIKADLPIVLNKASVANNIFPGNLITPPTILLPIPAPSWAPTPTISSYSLLLILFSSGGRSPSLNTLKKFLLASSIECAVPIVLPATSLK